MAVEQRRRSRLLLAAVLGLEVGMLSLGVFLIYELLSTRRGVKLLNLWQMAVLAGAMVMVYLMYLKKEKQKVEDLVVDEKSRTGALLDALPVAAMLLDEAGSVLAANSPAARLLGVDELELAAAEVREAVGGDLGRRLASGATGKFTAAARRGRRLQCVATPTGQTEEERARLVILEEVGEDPPGADRDAAGAEARDGCWEPAMAQLPDGEVQLFFANESPYRQSSEQELCGTPHFRFVLSSEHAKGSGPPGQHAPPTAAQRFASPASLPCSQKRNAPPPSKSGQGDTTLSVPTRPLARRRYEGRRSGRSTGLRAIGLLAAPSHPEDRSGQWHHVQRSFPLTVAAPRGTCTLFPILPSADGHQSTIDRRRSRVFKKRPPGRVHHLLSDTSPPIHLHST